MKVQSLEDAPTRPTKMRQAASAPIANVGLWERVLSALAGGALLGFGVNRKAPVTLVCSLAGGSLAVRALSGFCPVYQALGIDHSHDHPPAVAVPAQHGFKFEGDVKIHSELEEVYKFWRQLENLPQLFEHLDQVVQVDERYSRWCARGPLGVEVEWEAEIFNEKPNEMFAWRSLEGSELDTAGSVHFQRAVAKTGTIVRLSLKYSPPGGKLGAKIAELFGEDFEGEAARGLQKLKQILEAQAKSAS